MLNLVLLLCGCLQFGSADPVVEGRATPAFAWYTEGGSAARTGVSIAHAPQSPLVLAWEHDAGGRIVGDPLVWDDHIVLEIESATKGRLLRVLDLRSGQPIGADRRYGVGPRLGPTLWRDLIVLRSGEKELSALRIRSSSILPVWNFHTEGEVGLPLCFANEIYAATSAGLLRTRVGRHAADWIAGRGSQGRPSLLEDRVLVASMNLVGECTFQAYDRKTGAAVHELPIGAVMRRAITMDEGALVHAFDGALAASFPMRLDFGTTHPTQCVAYAWPPTSRLPQRMDGLWASAGAPCAWQEGWFGAWYQQGARLALVRQKRLSDDFVSLLATQQHNVAFASSQTGATRAGAIGFNGAQAFDLNSLRVLWRLPVEASSRVIPLRSHLLVVTGGNRLLALHESLDAATANSARNSSSPARAAPLTASQAVAVLRGGEVVRGAFALDFAGGVLSNEKKRSESWPLADVIYAEDETLGPIYASELRVGLERLIEEAEATAWAGLATDATKTLDLDLLGECLSKAESLGAEEKSIAAARRTFDVWTKKPPKPKDDLAVLLRGRIHTVEETADRMLTERAQLAASTLPGEAVRDPLLQVGLLRMLLERNPQHEGARDAVRELLPEGLRADLGGLRARVFPALDWLDVVEAGLRVPITILDPAPGEAAPPGASAFSVQALERARTDWRKDAVAFQSPNLLIVTSVERPGALARCLALGELVCESLSTLFDAEQTAGGEERPPLVIQLFGSREEYLERSEKWYGEAGSGLTWTAGYYDPGRNMTRLFVPEDDQGFEEVRSTLAHEITHHWLQVRCPAFRAVERDATMFTQPGYWIVEGFASFVDEFRFRTDLWSWTPDDPFSYRLDIVSSAGKDALLPWQELFTLSKSDFEDLSAEDEVKIPCASQLGPAVYLPSSKSLFYAQAACASRFLFLAENGKYRPALLAFLAAYYEGRSDGFDWSAATGASPAELGAQVQAYARTVFGNVPGVR